ncbi:TetR/AcrR family transcriptional regulator [Parafrankia elaeagni]|uniref:TetR/AcrR family transcriptional regulator n=1 Tax=Parafrankia elaeagni TaxID=222534 RepID=UPI0003640B33|nr:TetR/AcrR family transcriptional regulator [Parafrankia elaeagni]
MDGATRARPLRADARANYERLLAQARLAFAEHGTGASLEDIARRAGVGTGTFYRHFPSRDALLQAVLHDRFERLSARADALAATAEPGVALTVWLREFVEFTGAYRGLTAALLQTLRDPSTELYAACAAVRAAGATLLAGAQQAGVIRADLAAPELFALVSGLSWACEQSTGTVDVDLHVDRLLTLTLDGLRADGTVR